MSTMNRQVRPPAWLLVLAAAANVAATVPTVFVPDLLSGAAVMVGSARGTALIMLIVGVPLLLVAMALDRNGSRRAPVVRIGVLAYLAYNDFMLLFATPFNPLFLVYVAAMSSTAFALGASLLRADAGDIAARLPRTPARVVGGYVGVIVALNAFLWLSKIVPAMFAEVPTSFLDGTGIATNPVFVQDLVFWLPSAALIAWLTWTRRPWGTLLAGAYLVYGLVESIGVATDQWMGSSADPSSTVATMDAVVIFVVLAVIGIVALAFYARSTGAPTHAEEQAGEAPARG